MRPILILLLVIAAATGATAQKELGAYKDFEASKYENIPVDPENDAFVIFDRTYLTVAGEKDGMVIMYRTVHRKVKILSSYGLDRYNKFYTLSIDGYGYNTDLLDCKAKTIKPDNRVFLSDTADFLETTLPANSPFYYKTDGRVEMLALRNVNIGDEVEYVYTMKYDYQIEYEYFYYGDDMNFSNDDHCGERTFVVNARGFQVNFVPLNFPNGVDRNTDFSSGEHRYTVSLNDIPANRSELYEIDELEQPFLFFDISTSSEDGNENLSWEIIAKKQFQRGRKVLRGQYVFDSDERKELRETFRTSTTTVEGYEKLIEIMNKPLQRSSGLYESFQDDFSIAWAHAQIIARVMKEMSRAVDFHFVVNKSTGTFREDLVTLEQFDNVLVSFVDDTGAQRYFPLLEPFLGIDEIHPRFQNTKCLTISMTPQGFFSHSFDVIPDLDEGESFFGNDLTMSFERKNNDTLTLRISEKLVYSGETFLDAKPFLSRMTFKEKKAEKKLTDFVESILDAERIKNLENVQFDEEQNSFELSFDYEIELRMPVERQFVSLSLDEFLFNDFETSLEERDRGEVGGYLMVEDDLRYSLRFKNDDQFKWVENTALRLNKSNSLAKVRTDYERAEEEVGLTFQLHHLAEQFSPEQWPQMLEIRDVCDRFLSSSLYLEERR